MPTGELREEFEKRFVSNEWDNLHYGGKDCPKTGSYALYKISFLQTIYEMKRLGYKLPVSYKMPKRDVKQAEKIIQKMAKTWKIIYTVKNGNIL